MVFFVLVKGKSKGLTPIINLTDFLNEELALTLDVNDYCNDEIACEARAQKLLEPLEQKNTDFQWDKLKNLKPKK